MNHPQNNSSKDMAQEQSLSSLQYKNYLEEMELKIRYMKNDIEFKQEQMKSKVKQANFALHQSREKPHASWRKSPLPSYWHQNCSNENCTSQYNNNNVLKKDSKLYCNTLKKSVELEAIPIVESSSVKSKYSVLPNFPVRCSYEMSKVISSSISPTSSLPSSSSSLISHMSLGSDQHSSQAKLTSSSKSKVKLSTYRTTCLVKPNKKTNISTYQYQHPPILTNTVVTHTASTSSSISVSTDSDHHQPKCISTSQYKFVKPKTSTSLIIPASSPSIISKFTNIETKIVDNQPYNYVDVDSHSQTSRNETITGVSPGKEFHNFKSLIKNHPPLKVHTAARLISKYKLKRLSPSVSKTVPRFPTSHCSRTNIVSEPQKVLSLKSSTTCVSKYKLKKLSPTISKTVPVIHTSTDVVSNSQQVPSQLVPNESENIFKLDKRNVHTSKSKYKLDKSPKKNTCLSTPNSTNRTASKYRQPLKGEIGTENRYKWRQGCVVTKPRGNISKSARKNISSQYKWQHQALYPKFSQINHQSLFKWCRPNSRNNNILLRNLEMARLKQRLKVMMSYQRSSRMNWVSGAESHSNWTSSSDPFLSSFKEKDEGRKVNNRLVMIGHMLYKASSRKLTRAGTALPAKESISVTSNKEVSGHELSAKQLKWTEKKPILDSLPTPFTSNAKKKFLESIVVKSLRPQKMKLVTVRGVRFHVESNGTKLTKVNDKTELNSGHSCVNRVDIGGMTYIRTGPDTLELSPQGNKKLAASRAIHKSLYIMASRQRKNGRNKNKKPKNRHCLFFHRFGKCQHGNACPFIHDLEKVAVCSRFLRGQCESTLSCPFSHDASVHKMPVCLFYLQGLCSRQDCLYLHVKVSPDAPVCKDFLQGFCPLGLKCKNLHSFVCPCFAVFGKCPRKEKCSMLHRQCKKQIVEPMTAGVQNKKSVRAKNEKDNVNDIDGDFAKEGSLCVSSSLLTPQILNHSVYLPPPSDSILETQPSFISLVSPSYPSSNYQLMDQDLTTTPFIASTKHCYQHLKITPAISRPKTQDRSLNDEMSKVLLEGESVVRGVGCDISSIPSTLLPLPSSASSSALLLSSTSAASSLTSSSIIHLVPDIMPAQNHFMKIENSNFTDLDTEGVIVSHSSTLITAVRPLSHVTITDNNMHNSIDNKNFKKLSAEVEIQKTPDNQRNQTAQIGDSVQYGKHGKIVFKNSAKLSSDDKAKISEYEEHANLHMSSLSDYNTTLKMEEGKEQIIKFDTIDIPNDLESTSSNILPPSPANLTLFNKGIIPSFMTEVVKSENKS